MRAITIRLPWAALIAIGRKTVDVRPRPWSVRGSVVIHASAVVDERAAEWLREHRHMDYAALPPDWREWAGRTVAMVDVLDCAPMDARDADAACLTPECVRDAYGLHLGRARMLERVPLRGALGLWALPVDYVPRLTC